MTRIFKIAAITFSLISTSFGQANKQHCSINFCGEKLNYKMEYLNMNVADLTFWVENNKHNLDPPEWELNLKAQSTGFATKLFKIDNYYKTYFKTENFLPLKSIKNINQKNIQHELVINFDQQIHQASINDSLFWSIPNPCYDYFSMLYFIRSQPWEKGDTLNFFLDSEYLISKVKAFVMPENKILKLPCGKFKTIKIQMKFQLLTKKKRPWKTDIITNRLAKPGSKLNIWLSDDELRLPLKISYFQSLVNTKIILNSFSRRNSD